MTMERNRSWLEEKLDQDVRAYKEMLDARDALRSDLPDKKMKPKRSVQHTFGAALKPNPGVEAHQPFNEFIEPPPPPPVGCNCFDYDAFWPYYDTGKPPAYWHWCNRMQVFNFNLKTGEIFLYDPTTIPPSNINDVVRTFQIPRFSQPTFRIDSGIETDDGFVYQPGCYAPTYFDDVDQATHNFEDIGGVNEICGFWFNPNVDAIVNLLNTSVFGNPLPTLLDTGEDDPGRVVAVTIWEEFHRPYNLRTGGVHRQFYGDETVSLPKVMRVCYRNTPTLIEKGPCF